MAKKTAARLAFYIAKNGNFVDKAIAWWTNSKYSHVELICCNEWYSTSPRDLRVRKKLIQPTEGHWDYLDVSIDPLYLDEFFSLTQGRKYDWTGIWFTQFLPIGWHRKSRYFCSEWCAMVLGIKNPEWYSPESLYRYIKNGGKTR